ncbi:MAG: hypothetical protein P1U44_01510 [Vicingaceae bacterium]|nr:hypothetical protein [Vicingaceae bacterium]
MKSNIWELFKRPIMAIIIITKLMPGIPTFDTRLLFYAAVIIPFLPIIKYTSTFENKAIAVITIPYFIFYLISNIILSQIVKKIGSKWSPEEYNALKPDQITFPFILVIIINAGIHFSIFYLITNYLLYI